MENPFRFYNDTPFEDDKNSATKNIVYTFEKFKNDINFLSKHYKHIGANDTDSKDAIKIWIKEQINALFN